MKIQMSGLGVTAASGKIGGTVVSKGRSGQIARVRVKPTNPRTNSQTNQRSKFTTRSQAWRGLTPAEQAAWNSAADSGAFPLKNSLGVTFQPTGSQLYNQLNLNLVKVGASVITTPPVKESLPAILLGTLTSAAGTPALSQVFTGTLGTGYSLAVYATAPTSPGVSRPARSKFRYITTYTSTSPANLLAAYQAIYGDPIEGQKIFVIAEVVSETSGQTALAGSSVAIVAA